MKFLQTSLKYAFFTTCLMVTHSAFCQNKDAHTLKTEFEITQLLENWAKDFNEKNVQKVCNLYALDLIATYPGVKDKDYRGICENLRTILNQDEETFTYENPKIEQMIIDTNTVIARLKWRIKVAHKDELSVNYLTEKSLDIFRRQKDGSWKIVMSNIAPEELE